MTIHTQIPMQLAMFSRGTFQRGRPFIVQCLWLMAAPLVASRVILFSACRVVLLRLFGARIGRGVLIKSHVRIRYPWRLTIGDNTWIGENSWIDNWAPVVIGSNVCFSQSAYLCTGNHDWADPSFPIMPRPITIGDGAWVGACAVLAPGVEMGVGAIASLGAVVTRSIPAWEIHGGNPARLMKVRHMRIPDSDRSAKTSRHARRGGVLVVGPTHSRGGITSVIAAHSRMAYWSEFGCKGLNTFSDRGILAKVGAAALAYFRAPFLIFRAAIVHLHIAGPASMLRKAPLFLLAKLFRRSVIVHVHTPDRKWLLEGYAAWIFRPFCHFANRVVVLSPYWERALIEAGIYAPVSIIPNPMALPEAATMISDHPPRILFVGKLEARKGYADLIRAAAAVLERRPETELILAGHGELASAAALARSLGIEDSVRLMGWIEGKKLEECYRSATVFCLPSYGEGLSMSVLEAMSWGLPVVTTPVGALPDIVKSGVNGFLVDPGDIAQLGHTLTHLLESSPDDLRQIGIAGRQLVARYYSPRLVSHMLSALYSGLLDTQAEPIEEFRIPQSH